MNRLVIVGNGFDLAHGLPTGYCDFISGYWRKVLSQINLFENRIYAAGSYEDEIIKIKFQFGINFIDQLRPIEDEFKKVKTYKELELFINKYKFSGGDKDDYYQNFNDCSMSFKNSFFKRINDLNNIQNWVDIENEYYKLLKGCLKDEDNIKVTSLNKEFEQIKDLLEDYLIRDVTEKYNFDNVFDVTELLEIFKIDAQFLDATQDTNKYLKEFPKEDHEDLIGYDNYYLEALKSNEFENRIEDGVLTKQTVFLNFNYTPTVSSHLDRFRNIGDGSYGDIFHIHIHGKLGDSKNKINFGFGDEMDDHYKLIEEKDDNEYLKNIKSFQYLQNSNYKDLLDFVEGEKFQVYIMGHSCGLSDRILLNTIFEHQNCRSIKVFYFEKDGKDDYTKIVQNISRHFNKKKMMREKIVNKSLCQPLPQNVRFEEKQK